MSPRDYTENIVMFSPINNDGPISCDFCFLIDTSDAEGSSEALKASEESLAEDQQSCNTEQNENRASLLLQLPEVQALPEDHNQDQGNVIEITDVICLDDQPEVDSLPKAVIDESSLDHAAPSFNTRQNSILSRRPSKKSVSFFLVTADLGVSWQSDNGQLRISNVEPNGMLASACLFPGDFLLSINNVSCGHWSPKQVEQHLNERNGRVTLTLYDAIGDPSLTQATVLKGSDRDELGLAFSKENGRLRIRSFRPTGLLGRHSALDVGDYIVSVNDEPCFDIEQPSRQMLLSSSEVISVIATKSAVPLDGEPLATAKEIVPPNEDEHEDCIDVAPAFLSAMIFKRNSDAFLGIELSATDDDMIRIERVLPGGLLATTPLKEGFILISINNKPCHRMKLTNAYAVLRETRGELYLVAQDPLGDVNFVQAMATRLDPEAKVGVMFVSYQNSLHFASITRTGLFVNSVLNANDVVLAMNNVSCCHYTATEAADLVKQCPETVSILARRSSSAGIVVSTAHREPSRIWKKMSKVIGMSKLRRTLLVPPVKTAVPPSGNFGTCLRY